MKQSYCRFCRARLALTGDVCRDRADLRIGRCTECSLVQVDGSHHVPEQWYAADDYWGDLEAARQRERTWNQKRVQLLRHYIQGITEANILDYGSGHGGFLEAGTPIFRNLLGFDLSKRVCQAHRASGWRCVNSPKEVPHDIEVILLFHVIEHLPKPWEFLSELKQQFVNANTFVIEVPNLCEALHALFKSSPYQKNQFGPEHLYYFTAQTLRMVVETAGLRVVVDTQCQRYTLANHLGWLKDGTRGGQDRYEIFNDERLNEEYEHMLVESGLADSLLMICHSVSGSTSRGPRVKRSVHGRPTLEKTREVS